MSWHAPILQHPGRLPYHPIRPAAQLDGPALVPQDGLPLSVYVMPADLHDTQGARRLLAGLKYFVPRLKIIWADQAYQGHDLADWCRATGNWELDVVKRAPGVHGWNNHPRRWIVERTFAWLLCNPRLVVDDERTVQTSETLIAVAMIRLALARPGRQAERQAKRRVKHDVRKNPVYIP
jgi:putative transposase